MLSLSRVAWRRAPAARRALSTKTRHGADAAAPSSTTTTTTTATVLRHAVQPSLSPAHRLVADALSLRNASRREARRARNADIVAQFGRDAQDTGATEVQIALLTERIAHCTAHVTQHRQDKMSRRRLLMMVAQRRRLMQYLLRRQPQRYMQLVQRLALRPNSVFSGDRPLGARKTPTPALH